MTPHVFSTHGNSMANDKRFCCFSGQELTKGFYIHSFTVIGNIEWSSQKTRLLKRVHETFFFSQNILDRFLRNMSLSKGINGQLYPTKHLTSFLKPNVRPSKYCSVCLVYNFPLVTTGDVLALRRASCLF